MQRTDPRVFARPFELRRGQSLIAAPAGRSAERSRLRQPRRGPDSRASSRSAGTRCVLMPRDGDRKGQTVRHRVRRRARAKDRGTDARSTASSCRLGKKTGRAADARRAAHHRARPDRPREAPRRAAAAIPQHMIQAVLAIEDRRFYDHPGVDPDRHRRRRLQQRVRQQGLPARRQHAHPAAGQEHVPDARRRRPMRKMHGVVHVGRARAAAVARIRSSSST